MLRYYLMTYLSCVRISKSLDKGSTGVNFMSHFGLFMNGTEIIRHGTNVVPSRLLLGDNQINLVTSTEDK